MQSYKGRFEPTRFEDLTVTVDFHCHSACRFCIVQEGMNLFRGVPFERYQQAVDDNGRAPRYRRVTFTGGEVTLEKKLLEYVDYARERGGFEHIRLQTNGRLLANRDYARLLIDRGIDEFFVSIHGPDAACQDYISQREGSFDEAWAGMRNLRELGAVLLTNTVLTTLNVDRLTEIVDLVSELEPSRMEFWNYLPMEDFTDERGLVVPARVLGPAMRSALARARELGLTCAVKYVPMCVLGEYGDAIDNTQPDVVIVEDFYEVYPKFSCLWEAQCEHSEACLGLTHSYIAKYGWERDLLVPTPRTTPWEEPEDGLALPSDTPTGPARREPEHHPAWLALLEGAPERAGVSLATLLLDRRRCTFRLQTPGGSTVDLLLTKRSEDRPSLARSRSFDMSYRSLQLAPGADETGERALLSRALKEAVAVIKQRDDGSMMLDERKGLVGPEAMRRRPGQVTP
jgi:MoaA/NifB/PqqE/SkfB family radical SAM enzyme